MQHFSDVTMSLSWSEDVDIPSLFQNIPDISYYIPSRIHTPVHPIKSMGPETDLQRRWHSDFWRVWALPRWTRSWWQFQAVKNHSELGKSLIYIYIILYIYIYYIIYIYILYICGPIYIHIYYLNASYLNRFRHARAESPIGGQHWTNRPRCNSVRLFHRTNTAAIGRATSL